MHSQRLLFHSSLLNLLLGLLTAGAAAAQPGPAQHAEGVRELPASFVADRIYVHPVTAAGDTLRLFTDTGGGGPLLLESVAERLGLTVVDTVATRGGRPTPVARMPTFHPEAALPAVPDGRAYVFPPSVETRLLDMGDGLLGQSWFAGRVWIFDYGAEALLVRASAEGLAFDPAHTAPLGFPVDSSGARTRNFPSIEATIDGETHAFLFDTGASMVLTDSARAALGGPPVQGASFVAASLFERWREAHPDWRVVENGSRFGGGAPLIEVPAVTIAGHTVGPVWFEPRPDANFHKGMSSMMDRRVEGALGGSLFRYFRVTVDYPGARAFFERLESSGAENRTGR